MTLSTFLHRLYHYAAHAVGGAAIVVSLVAMVLKFWVMPDIDRFRPDLEAAASRALGHPVTIGAVAADWRGINPRLTLRELRMTPAGGAPLVVPRVEAVASWFTLPLLEPRLTSLRLDGASLDLRRDAGGVITLAGIPLNRPGATSPFPDWLLRQPRIVVADARVRWLDDKLAAPPLEFGRIRLLLENRFGRHRFGGIAEPADAARRVELRGDLKGRSVHALKDWSGELYAQVGGARFETWGRWVPWAQEAVKTGVGALRLWLVVNGGELRGLTGDARLDQVALNFQKALPDMVFDRLSGRIGWSRDRDAHTVSVEQLRFTTPGGGPALPASVRVTLNPDGQGGFKRIDARADNLRLEALTALSSALPLPRRGRELLAAFTPRGLVQHAQGHWSGPRDYGIELDMREAGARAHGHFPGFTGLDLRLKANQAAGHAELAGRQLGLDWPRLFRHRLDFARLDTQADWQAGAHGLRVQFAANRIVNADLTGSARGWLELPPKGAPRVDIRAHLERGEARAVYRYLPWPVADDAYSWLSHSLKGGHARDVRMVLKGDLARFPFDAGGGVFNVTVPMVDGELEYSPHWPRITGIQGMLVFHDKAMTIDAHAGRILDAQLGPVTAVIPDLHTHGDKSLHVNGRARGETRAFLDFIRQTPVFEHTGRFTERLGVAGTGELALQLDMPLRHVHDTTVRGDYTLQSNRVDPGEDLPVLEQVTGHLAFTGEALAAKDLHVRVLGQAARLDLESKPGGLVHARLDGRIGATDLRPHLPATLAGRVTGIAAWQAEIGLTAERETVLLVKSDLKGLVLDLPAPLGKPAALAVPFTFGNEPGEGGARELSARYGGLMAMRARLPVGAPPQIHIHLGQDEVPAPKQAGIRVTGRARYLDIDAWRGLGPAGGEGAAGLPPLKEASLTVGELNVFQRRLHDTRLQLRPGPGGGWSLAVAGKEVTGDLITVPEGKATRLMANFKRLAIPEPGPGAAPAGGNALAGIAALELNADSFAWKGRDLGELRLRMSPAPHGLRIDNFSLASPEGRIVGNGLVADHKRRPTRVELVLETPRIGELLGRIGHPGAIKGGQTRLSGYLGWQGGLEDFNLRTLEGDLNLTMKQGQFLKVDPGAARLLGILSLQSLPRRITLDFRDVFSEGFAFDEIYGRLYLAGGGIYTRDLRMNGPAAKINASGVLGLADETQNLRLHIQPRLEDTLAVAGAIIGGPAVGIGTLLANKLLKNPIGQAVAFDYVVSGTWAEPVVKKLPRVKPE